MRRRRYSELARKELAIFETAAAMLRALRPRGAPPLHHLAHRDVSDLLEVLLLQKEDGPAARHARRRRGTAT